MESLSPPPAPDNSLITITRALLDCMRVRVTRTSVRQQLSTHPEYPSMLSLSQALTSWNVENVALQLGADQLAELEAPFVTTLTDGNESGFVLVKQYSAQNAMIIDGSGLEKKIPLHEFTGNCSGAVLLAERSDKSGEARYLAKRRKEIVASVRTPVLVTITFFVAATALYNTFPLAPAHLASAAAYFLGCWICGLLIVPPPFDGGRSQFCRFSGAGCKKVRESDISRATGTTLAEAGLLYFLSGLVLLLAGLMTANEGYFTILKWAGALSLPVTLVLLYYQWRVIRGWCPLCLSVHAVLWINFFLLPGPLDSGVSATVLLNTALWFCVTALAWALAKPVLIAAIQSRAWKAGYLQIKNDRETFNACLQRQPRMPAYDPGVRPITIGNAAAENTLTLVTNPYCPPCSKIHSRLDSLIHRSSNIKLDVIFYNASEVSRHIMAIHQQEGTASSALKSWYAQPKPDYRQWAAHFPVGNTEDFDASVRAHADWCRASGIPHTPFVMLNGFPIPRNYDIEDIFHLVDR